MWDWLGAQAQTASPFVAVFCLFMLGGAGLVISKLWRQHLDDHLAIVAISKANTEANSAVAIAIERSTSTTILAIAQLKDSLSNNGNGRRR